MEIYNESVRDLLSADNTPLRLLDDPERGTIVEKLTEATLKDWNHFKELLSVCEAQRQIGETFLNEASSRSHQILRLTIESSAREFIRNDKSSSLTATVNFVDLAGSERASQSLSAGARLKEGCHINRSLLTLGTVIRKLSKGRNGHVPFRDSKLTRILQSSLGGNARTAIICTMSPARSHVEQSRNTLLFASCAKDVSTNAKVNVVMSDKVLVKNLQRELARLEGELRSSGLSSVTSNSTALLREKDLQIEKLMKEIKELTLQRDLAHSQVNDLLQLVGDDKPALVQAALDHHYPKLRVRTSWIFENQMSETTVLADPHCLDVGVRSCDASQYSGGHSRSSSDDNLFQLPDFEQNFSPKHSSPHLMVTVPKFVGPYCYQEETEEQTDDKSEDICKVVQCIEMEEPITNRFLELNMSDSSPKIYVNSKMSDSSPDRYVNKKLFDSSLNKYTNSSMSSPVANTATSRLMAVENGDKANQELGSHLSKEDKYLKSFVPGFVVPSPESPSPLSIENYMPSSKCLRLTRSRSCKSSLMTSMTSPWFEKVEKHESTPIGFEKDFTGRPEGLQRKLSTLKYDAFIDSLSRNKSQTSAGIVGSDELKVLDAKSPVDEDSNSRCTSTAGINEMILEMEPKPIASARSVKEVGLDQVQVDTGSPSRWPSEFKRLQREILELWHACNISLVHRTYFFLLFNGDPTDSIYMKVELRRLSFIHQIFSQGSQTVEDGEILTPTSSMKALRRERQMLGRQMQKMLSKQDRQNLYLKWGIGLNTKHRTLQLVHCLWTDTRNMDHITESADLVAKLVGSVEPGKAFKEMFGLSFTPRYSAHRSFRWKSNKYLP
ncbi:hypothetical protein I3842_08G134600 [Carya illinoinensis]|nr:hypothetical protein I3842_08G134600 [Carya illinoinensis]